MAIKKSEIYSSLWASCDELRGGMDASQYKDYILTLLFVKYQTAFDPACGSGSLLIKATDEAPCHVAIYGQEKETTTAGLAKMNFVLHNRANGEIRADNSFTALQYFDNDDYTELKRFDYVVTIDEAQSRLDEPTEQESKTTSKKHGILTLSH